MIKRKEQYNEASHLSVSKDIRVRFNETDPLGIVWHVRNIAFGAKLLDGESLQK